MDASPVQASHLQSSLLAWSATAVAAAATAAASAAFTVATIAVTVAATNGQKGPPEGETYPQKTTSSIGTFARRQNLRNTQKLSRVIEYWAVRTLRLQCAQENTDSLSWISL